MFTGIVEEVGRITRIEQRGENRRITVAAEHAPREFKTGDSVAVSGVCLTALDIKPGSIWIVLRRPRSGDLGSHIVLAHSRRRAGEP